MSQSLAIISLWTKKSILVLYCLIVLLYYSLWEYMTVSCFLAAVVFHIHVGMTSKHTSDFPHSPQVFLSMKSNTSLINQTETKGQSYRSGQPTGWPGLQILCNLHQSAKVRADWTVFQKNLGCQEWLSEKLKT